MKDVIKQKFIGDTWIECVSKIKHYADEYFLGIVSIDLKKEDYKYSTIGFEKEFGLDQKEIESKYIAKVDFSMYPNRRE